MENYKHIELQLEQAVLESKPELFNFVSFQHDNKEKFGIVLEQFEYNQPSGQTGKPTNIAVGEMPLSGNLIVTTRFGMGRTNSDGSARTHAGLDIVNTNGDHKLYAIADGTVIANDWLNGGGNFIRIRRKDNNDVYQYLHLANRSPINVGTEVKKGQLFFS